MRKKKEKKRAYCKPMTCLIAMPGRMSLMAGSINSDIVGTNDGGNISGESTTNDDSIGQGIDD